MGEDERPVRGGRVARTAPLVGLAGRTAGETVVASLRLRARDRAEGRAAAHARAAERYAERLGRSKGVLMKAGQLLSFVSFGPMVGEEYQSVYQAALTRLQDDAPPMPPELAERTIEAELGAPPGELFAEFTPTPLAAASIGQVHAARLRDGRRVAVKVQYPGVEEAIRADLANTELLATFFRLARGMMPRPVQLDVRGMAREVAERIGEEIDYRTEAAHQREFADYYRGHPFIRIPEVVPELSTRRVLTTELADGLRFADALKEDQRLKDLWGETVFRFSVGGLRTLRLFNGDPHPGNYLFHRDGTVTFLDFGCVRRFTAEQMDMIVASVRAAVAGDAEALTAAFRASGFLNGAEVPEPAELLAYMRESLRASVAPQPFTFTREYAARVVEAEYAVNGEFREVIRKMTPPPHFLFLSRIDLGVTAILGELNATGPWEAIRQEWDEAGPPATPYGEQDRAFRRAADHVR
jgi:predicted unusual protein kinase regulating ubiquinone biosynthesis (AarF/ABC1/UbiB family)